MTLVWSCRGRIQLAGRLRTSKTHQLVAIVGGTGDFSRADGYATIDDITPGASKQRITLHIL